MAWDHLFNTTNDVGVKATYQKTAPGSVDMSKLGAQWGVCAAMSALWLHNMMKGRDLLSAPDMARAGMLYSKWANRQDARGLSSEQFNVGICENAGLEIESVESLGAASATLHMSALHGAYYISSGNHAMATVTGGAGYYFFDPNGGAWKTSSLGEFNEVKSFVEGYSGSAGYNPSWMILRVLRAT